MDKDTRFGRKLSLRVVYISFFRYLMILCYRRFQELFALSPLISPYTFLTLGKAS